MKHSHWQRWLSALLCMAMLVSLVPAAALTAYAEENQANYVNNQGQLHENAFVRLPMGAVEAKDWLLQQLYYQKEGLTGLLQDNYAIYGPNNAWRGGTGDNWEKGPYYLRGLMSLAWVLDDPELKEMAMEWIDPILESQTATGYFGPSAYGDGTGNGWDWWPHMVVLQLLRDYYEATELEGDPDERVLDVLGNYFRFQLNYLNDNHVLDYWASARGADNMDVVLWYYNRVYDEANPNDSDWLIDLAYTIYSYSYNWTDIYTDGTARQHVVNTTQGWKNPAVVWQLTGSERNRDGLWYALRNMGIDHGRIDNLPNADELARTNIPYHGTETCAVVEGMLSHELSIAILGEGWIGDELEYLAYNSLPACYTNDFTAHVYYQTQNQVMATHGGHEHLQEHSDSIAFSVLSGYECCFPNMHMGWPKFVQNMWMATNDGGLALIAYGPNEVTAKVADGANARFRQETDYPFKDTIGLTYEGESASFPLKLRVPGWCTDPSFAVNGEKVTAQVVDGFITIDRKWTEGDVVEIVFPMEVRVSNWYNDSVAVKYGTLAFSVNVEEEWVVATDDSAAGAGFHYPQNVEKPNDYETLAGSDWNYALVIDWDDIAGSFEVVVDDEVGLQPFTQGYSPITIKATGQLVPDWKLKGNVVPEPPYSPIAEDVSLQEEIELIPYGAARLRVTQIPWVGENNEDLATVRTAQQAQIYQHDGKTVTEFDNVMVRTADNYVLTANYTGTGSVTVEINTKYTKTYNLTGEPLVIENMNRVTSGDFKFGYGQYNNIRFIGDGNVHITDLTVTPVNPFTTPVIENAYFNSTLTKMTVETNISRAAGFWSLEYGTEPGVYTATVENLFEDKTVITGLSGEVDTYYVRASMLANGEKVYSQEFTVNGTREVIKAEFYDDFSDPAASAAKWEIVGDASVASFSGGELKVGQSTDIKLTTGDEDWTDYAIETTISSHSINYNNFGVFFRATNVTSGPNSLNGYYVGIEAASQKGVMVGYLDGNWHQLAVAGDFAYNHNQDYELKILVCGNAFKVYVDGQFIYELTDNRFGNGKVGLRSYWQPFDVDEFEVRPLTDAEIKLFEGGGNDNEEEYEEFAFAPSSSDWELLGNTASMSLGSDGSLTVQPDANIKALTGDTEWKDYVVQADVALYDEETTTMAQYHNGGLIFRSTEATGVNADSYKGYYFGIGNYENGQGGYAVIGYGNYGWYELNRIRYDEPFELGKNYNLKVIVCGDKMAFYLDGEKIATATHSLFAQGRVGARGWTKGFKVSNLSVRSLTDADIAVLTEPVSAGECLRVHNAVQMFFPAMAGDANYTVAYGTEPGVYTTYVTNLVGMDWTENVKLTVSLPDNDTTYYARVFATNTPSVFTKEVELKGLADGGTIGYAVTDADKADVVKLMAEAKERAEGNWDKESGNRLDRAIEFAETVLADADVNMSEISLAQSNLKIGLNNLVESTDENMHNVQEVMDAIDAIGEVTSDSEQQLKEIRAAYEALSDTEKALVDNYELLVKAEQEFRQIPARDVMAAIAAIGQVSADSEQQLKEVRAAYEALSDELKALVDNYDVLVAAECEYQVFVAQQIAEEAKDIAADAKADAEAAEAAAEAAAAIRADDKSAAEAAAQAAEDARQGYENTLEAAGAAEAAVEAVKAAALAGDPEAVEAAIELVEDAVAETRVVADTVRSARDVAEVCLNAQTMQAEAEATRKEAEEAAQKAKEEREAAEKAAEEARKAAEAAAAALKLALAKYDAADELADFAKDFPGTQDAVVEGMMLINTATTVEKVEAALAEAKKLVEAAAETEKTCPSENFADVEEDAWYHEYVDYMVQKGYMNGVSDTRFDVNGSVTRAQLVTILYRTEGSPSVAGKTNPFTDVEAGAWFTDAIIWAADKGIVKGITQSTFAPNEPISRQQIVTILFRFEGGKAVAEDWLAGFTDAGDIADYAVDGMNWAIANEIVNGVTDTTLAPAATATRAQICAIVMRYLEK